MINHTIYLLPLNQTVIGKLVALLYKWNCTLTNTMIGTTHKPCDESEFQCNNGQCIPSGWECDGEEDCISGEDEQQQKCCE